MRKIGIGAIALLVVGDGVRGADVTRWSEAEGRGLVCAAAVAGRQQLHSIQRQSTSWKCGRQIRFDPQAHRPGTGLGGIAGHEHHARVPARSALAAGPRGIQEAHRYFSEHRAEAPHQATVCAVRFLLGSQSQTREATRADARRAQFRLGAKPGSRSAQRPRRNTRGWKRMSKASSAPSPATNEFLAGTCGTSRTTRTTAATTSSEPANKVDLVLALLPKVFAWARAAGASQPLTSGVWEGDWSSPEKLGADGEDPAGAFRHHLFPQLR